MKYDPEWLQHEAERLGTWQKVCACHKISPDVIRRYKKKGLIRAVELFDVKKAQRLYDDGMSLRQLSKVINRSVDAIRSRILTRSVAQANKMRKVTFSEAGLVKLSEAAKKNKLGGYRPHPNRGQRYKDIWFDSKWEVRVAMSLDEFGIRWIRPSYGFVWTDCGRRYFPDFYLPDFDVYLDPKNPYLQKKDAVKIREAQERNGIRVLVLSEQELSWKEIAEMM